MKLKILIIDTVPANYRRLSHNYSDSLTCYPKFNHFYLDLKHTFTFDQSVAVGPLSPSAKVFSHPISIGTRSASRPSTE